MPIDLAVLGQDPRFGGGALAQTSAFLSTATELGRRPELVYSPHPGLERPALTWRRVEALRQLEASRTLAGRVRDARSCWVVATVAHHGAAAPRSGHPYGCWLGTTIASEWNARAPGLDRSRRLAAGLSVRTLRAMERRVIDDAAVVYATSRASIEQVAQAAGRGRDEIGLLPIPIDLDCFRPEPDERWLERASSAPLIGFVGRAGDPRKNVPLLLQAFELVRRELPAARLQLVGEPPSRPVGAGVEATGVVEEVAPHLRRCTLLVLPSFQEGFGIVVAEALASGVPAVVTPCDGPEEMVSSSGAGRVAPGWTPQELAGSLLELLTDLGALARARAAARPYVECEHAPGRFRALLAEALGRLDGA